jgi:hypothetical protein
MFLRNVKTNVFSWNDWADPINCYRVVDGRSRKADSGLGGRTFCSDPRIEDRQHCTVGRRVDATCIIMFMRMYMN